MLRSIRFRLTLSHLLVIVIAMGLSGFLMLSFLDNYFTQAAEDSLLAQARITVQALLPGASPPQPIAEGDLPLAASNTLQQRQLSNLSVEALDWGRVSYGEMGDTSLQLSADLTTHIRILNPTGIVTLDSWGQELGANLGSHVLASQALEGRVASAVGDDLVMSLAYPAMLEGELQGVILLSQPLDDVAAVLSDLRGRWLLATGIALLLSGALGLLLSGAITRPLRQLTQAAGAVADGELDQQVPVRSRDEIGSLSQVFNEMITRLRASRQMQTDFVANVSHELRTPLTAVKGTVETLRDGAVDDPHVRDRFLRTVESETDRLIRLVNDLLLLSRADSEALNLRPEAVDMTALIPQTVDRLRPAAEKRGVELELRIEENCPTAWADRDRIEQVLLNLLDNGIKYSEPGSQVLTSVRSDLAGNSLLVEIADQGEGIPAEELPYIGRRFYRADKARSRSRGGSGLGLAIAQALVRAHGGTMELESQESQGTRVRFTLPAVGPVLPPS